MSAGTMISLSCKTIIMGKQSNIGPIDPQFGGMSCAGVLEEFEKAYADITQFPGKIVLWQPIISKYHPTFLGDCQKAIDWSNTMVCEWLKSNMLYDTPELAESIVSALSSHDATKNHARHIHIEECESLGIKIEHLENLKKEEIDECADFQDCVLTIHHAYMHTFSKSNAIKIVENQNGNAMISQMQ